MKFELLRALRGDQVVPKLCHPDLFIVFVVLVDTNPRR